MKVDYKFIKDRSVEDLTKFRDIINEVIKEVEEGDLNAYEFFLFDSDNAGSFRSIHELLAIRYEAYQEYKGKEWPDLSQLEEVEE